MTTDTNAGSLSDEEAEAAFLLELRGVLDQLQPRELIYGRLVSEDGCCALGAVLISRGLATAGQKRAWTDKKTTIPRALDISFELANRVASVNDSCPDDDPAERWRYMRKWVDETLTRLV